jgi:hypothetical protein
MGWWDEIGGPEKEAFSLLGDSIEFAGEATPWLGAIVGGGEAMMENDEAVDAERAGDQDKADYLNGRAGYDWAKAVPFLGTMLGGAELVSGGFSVAGGGEFHEGMENFRDTFEDVGSMIGGGMDWVLGNQPDHRAHNTIGSHAELRHEVEESDRFEEYRKTHERF